MRVFAGFVMVAAVASLHAPAAAEKNVLDIKVGEAITLTLDDGGRVVVVERGKVPPLTLFQAAVARNFMNGKYDWAGGPIAAIIKSEDGVPEPDEIKSGVITAKLVQLGDQTILYFQNGYRQALKFSAVIARGKQRASTDVCEVLPLRHGIEHWPYPFDRLELSGIKLTPWRDDRAPVCE